jgi:hypothetical protein
LLLLNSLGIHHSREIAIFVNYQVTLLENVLLKEVSSHFFLSNQWNLSDPLKETEEGVDPLDPGDSLTLVEEVVEEEEEEIKKH